MAIGLATMTNSAETVPANVGYAGHLLAASWLASIRQPQQFLPQCLPETAIRSPELYRASPAGEAQTNGQAAASPSFEYIDPIAHAWRACNPRVPLPAVLRRSGGYPLER